MGRDHVMIQAFISNACQQHNASHPSFHSETQCLICNIALMPRINITYPSCMSKWITGETQITYINHFHFHNIKSYSVIIFVSFESF